MADDASELFEQERDAGLAEELREELAAVERAEQRLMQGTYGLSVESGEPIPDDRLEAVPWAERTVEEQARYDQRRLRPASRVDALHEQPSIDAPTGAAC